jgi:hypothetical protein
MLLAPDRGYPQKGPAKPDVFSTPLDEDQLVIAITAGLAIASVPSVRNSLELPGLDQTPITAFVIMIAIHRDPHSTAATRALGCFVGGAYGLLCLGIIDDSLFLWVGLLFLGLCVSGHILHRNGEASYMGHQAGVAVLLAMVEGNAPSVDILPAIDRLGLVGIFGGIVLVAVFQNLLSPLVRWCVRTVVRPASGITK